MARITKAQVADNTYAATYCHVFGLDVPPDRGGIWSGDLVFDKKTGKLLMVKRGELAELRRRSKTIFKVTNQKDLVKFLFDRDMYRIFLKHSSKVDRWTHHQMFKGKAAFSGKWMKKRPF